MPQFGRPISPAFYPAKDIWPVGPPLADVRAGECPPGASLLTDAALLQHYSKFRPGVVCPAPRPARPDCNRFPCVSHFIGKLSDVHTGVGGSAVQRQGTKNQTPQKMRIPAQGRVVVVCQGLAGHFPRWPGPGPCPLGWTDAQNRMSRAAQSKRTGPSRWAAGSRPCRGRAQALAARDRERGGPINTQPV